MSRVLGTLVLALLLGVPAVVADHVYSHQYRVFGRVMDAEGNPLEGALVFIELKKTQQPDRISFRSNCTGLYGLAGNEHFHTHGLSTVAELQVSVFDPSDPEPLAVETLKVDRDRRVSHVDWKLEDAGNLTRCEGARAEVERQVFVTGRLWNATKEQRLEQVTVWGEIPGPDGCRAQCQQVEVAVTTDDGRTKNATVFSNNYGDYFAYFDMGAPYEGGEVEARWLDRTSTADIDPEFHTAVANLYQGEPRSGRTAPAGGLALVAVAALLGAVLRAGRR